jgi:DNA polymerase elongation subunit (family B)
MYQNISYDKKTNIIHLWDDRAGYQKFAYKPYAYLPDNNGEYVSLNGVKLSKVNGDFKDNPDAYESDVPVETRVLIDLYYESDEPSKNHRDLFFDIEVDISEKYPSIEDADCKITSIGYLNKTNMERRVLILDERRKLHNVDTEYNVEIFRSESELLTRFINIFSEIQPTVITGWNTDNFDIPYLINRCKRVLGASSVKKLSPIGNVEWSKTRNRYKIHGVSSLDYLRLYQNFTYTELPNYRLDTVAKIEVGRGKIEYEGDLNTLFESDINKFIEYNMTDVDLVYELDEKLQLLNLARTICHKGHVPYDDVYYASRYLDGSAIVDLKRKGIVAPSKQFKFIEEETQSDVLLAGAYVKEPVPGLYEWIYDLDLTSLYPSIIMSLNISPETKVGVIDSWDEQCLLKDTATQVRFTDGTFAQDVKTWLQENNYTVGSNGTVYRTDKKGFLPAILEKWFDERVEYKNKRDEYEVGTEQYKFYDALQLTQKVLLNSFYGVLGLKTFRFYDLDNAGAITSTGQSVIKFSAMVINKYYERVTGADHFINSTNSKAEFAFYTDTDSTFVSSLPIIRTRYPEADVTDEVFMIEKTNEIASEIQKHVNNMYDMYAIRFHNTKTHRWQIKQEYIAKSGLWIAKKRYAQWVIFKEGKPTNKIDIKGMDVVRSSFPTDFKTIMKETLWYILKKRTKTDTTDLIMDFKSKIKSSHVLNVMKNSSVKDITKYTRGRETFSGYLSGTPAHVKAAINYNDLLSKYAIKTTRPIIDGEKIKWAYLADNPYGFDTIAVRGYEDPEIIMEFLSKYIDRSKIFERELKGKIDDLYAALGWGALPENNNMNKFFSFGK